jgi:hypothetical protein
MPEPNDPTPEPPPEITNPQLVVLEALKIAHASTGAAQYLSVYGQLCQRVAQRLAPSDDGASGAQPHPSTPPLRPPAAAALAAADVKAAPGVAGITRMRVICATRADRESFFSETALGRSLSLHRAPGVELRLFPRNSDGLPGLYNTAISESIKDDVIFVFVHDDVHLSDFHWAARIAHGLAAFDVLGLVGNRRRAAGQPGWLFLDEKLTRDSRENLSGAVAHGRGFVPDSIDAFGPAGQEVKLLDGVLLAVTSATLRAKPLRFDERFDFHFYDLDFCRQAELAGLRMGTWPISVVHESKGNFASDGWRLSYEKYFDKWRQ